jgi:hypothetical protein
MSIQKKQKVYQCGDTVMYWQVSTAKDVEEKDMDICRQSIVLFTYLFLHSAMGQSRCRGFAACTQKPEQYVSLVLFFHILTLFLLPSHPLPLSKPTEGCSKKASSKFSHKGR